MSGRADAGGAPTAPGAEAGLRARAAEFGLSAAEYDRVVDALGRHPNVLEAAMFGALWSEHCGYKNSRPLLRRLPTEGPQVLQGPGENAGVVDLGDGWAAAFKMESHNHPSAVEPVQGAATGVGGILRDIFAMGARPVAVLDSLRFGGVGSERDRHLLSGVVEGIGLYGNAIGVPTVGGEIAFHPSYAENPLVNVMAVGIMRHEDLQSGTVGEPGNLLVYVGSRTGRDGLGGAVFASADLSEASEADRPAVQVGDPFLEKLLLEACLEAIREGLVVGVQDMGAAGLTSSVGEMAHRGGHGVDLHVDRVPRREEGMTPLETMLSESQERMVLTARPERVEPLLALLRRWELDAVVIGEVVPAVAGRGRLRILDGGEVAGDMPLDALNDAPTATREGVEDPAVREARGRDLSDLPSPGDLAGVLPRLLARPTIASKRAVFERFDHQVMTNTVVLPGAGDAAVIRIKGSSRALAASTDQNPRYCRLDPKLGAMHAVAEAARNVACVGATPLAITDNLNFGNPERPDVYWEMERAVEGLAEACLALGTPVTGGNVSLYNQYRDGERLRGIHPTPTVGLVGVLPDAARRATLELKRDGDVLLLVGPAAGTLGATEYLALEHDLEAGAPPALDLALEKRVQDAVAGLIQDGAVDTAHDLSEGGLAVALAEMAIRGGRGASVGLSAAAVGDAREDEILYGEGASRVLLAFPAERLAAVRERLDAAGVPHHRLGATGGPLLEIRTPGGRHAWDPAALRDAWEAPLREALS